MPSTVEALVVSYGSAAVIERLLASLAEVAPGVPVAVREHGPDAGPVLALRHTAGLRVEHDPSNPGFGAGCNALAAGSAADFVVFLNPDTVLLTWPWSPTGLPPRETLIGPVMREQPEQHYGTSYRIRDEIALSWFRRTPRRPEGTGYVSGAALLVDRATFQRLGGFDEEFFMFYEDIDLCRRANAAGYRTVVDDRWRMAHGRGHSTVSRFAESLRWSYDSALYYYAKYGSPVWAYRAYKVVDASLRATVHAVRRTGRASAYTALARRALSS